MFKQGMVQLQEVNRDGEARLMGCGREEPTLDQGEGEGSAKAALDIDCFVI
jgi:hypothetical protein